MFNSSPVAILKHLSLAILFVGCGQNFHLTEARPTPSAAVPTTLERSLFSRPGSPEPGTGTWVNLTEREGYPVVRRTDLLPPATAQQVAPQIQREALASFVQITDMHIVDAASPTRAGMLAAFLEFDENFADAIRPQEPLTTQVMEAMVRQINAVARGPVTGVPFHSVVSTGDNGDSKLMSELNNYVAILNGTQVKPDPSGRYVGVQDRSPAFGPEVYTRYYHPDPPPEGFPKDRWKTELGYEEFPGLLEAASAPFTATGLNFPWYAGNGNHDVAYLGDLDVSNPEFRQAMDTYATGDKVIVNPAVKLEPPFNSAPGSIAFALTAFGSRSADMLRTLVENSDTRITTASESRQMYFQEEFYDAHLAPGKHGPEGHGLTPANRSNKVMDFPFDLTLPGSNTKVLGLMMDTVNPSAVKPWTLEEFAQDSEEVLHGLSLSSQGSIGSEQWKRLELQLQSVHSRYFGENGEVVETGNEDQLVIVFSHHNSWTMNNLYVDETVPGADGPRLGSETFLERIKRYPNVIAWVNGHTHANTIIPHQAPSGGFWEINTASHLDFPQQARTLELVDNGDGTLSLYGILLDHAGPAQPENRKAPFTLLDLASISRLLAFNNPYVSGLDRMGRREDRNVELLIPDPRK